MQASGDITRLLAEMKSGNAEARSRLFEAVMPELRRLAGRYMRPERVDHILQPTALVNEAYVRMAGDEKSSWHNRAHFFAIASLCMRQILTDHARREQAAKRGAGAAAVELDENCAQFFEDPALMLTLLGLFEKLEDLDPRLAKVAEMRCFGGMTNDEIAEVLGVHAKTVSRDWEMARDWLNGRLRSRSQSA